jgi:hypothetical protein
MPKGLSENETRIGLLVPPRASHSHDTAAAARLTKLPAVLAATAVVATPAVVPIRRDIEREVAP